MKWIDCSASVGLDPVNRLIINHENYPVYERVRQAKDAHALLEEMDFVGVDQALIYHQGMFDVSPEYGNPRTIQEVSACPERLLATWAVLPPITEPQFAPGVLFPAMKREGVVALRAFPGWNRYVLCRVTMGDLLDAVTKAFIPLFLSPMDGWEYIYGVLDQFPNLTVVITNYGLWGSDRYVFPLVNAYKNVYFDTSDYQELGGYRTFVNRFGADRLLFGSNFPMDNIGGTLATLVGAGLTSSQVEQIAHLNIERLLGEVSL